MKRKMSRRANKGVQALLYYTDVPRFFLIQHGIDLNTIPNDIIVFLWVLEFCSPKSVIALIHRSFPTLLILNFTMLLFVGWWAKADLPWWMLHGLPPSKRIRYNWNLDSEYAPHQRIEICLIDRWISFLLCKVDWNCMVLNSRSLTLVHHQMSTHLLSNMN